jgi:hypothetical protein
MVDPQRVVEGIRSLLYAGQAPPLDALQALAADYAEACKEVNRRLARCEEFLRQGLRAEAIHFAQAEPNVLDLLAVLDFAERPHWDQLLASCSLSAAPVFRMETATALNRAYAEAQPLEHLLRQHRLLALGRAPLGERLAVLRQLAQCDAQNPVWRQDVATFESVRVEQLQQEVAGLMQQSSMPPLEKVQGLLEEVQGGTWRLGPPPPGLLAALQEMYQRVNTNRVQGRLNVLSRELPFAQRNKDEAQARQLMVEWQQMIAQIPLPPSDPRCVAVAGVVRWLEKLDGQHANAVTHQQDLVALQEALRRPAIRERELEALYFAAVESGGKVPPPMEAAYNQRMDALSSARRRFERIFLITVTSLAVIALAAFLLFVTYRPRG